MAPQPDAGADLSEDVLDAIFASESDEPATRTPDPEPTTTDPTGDAPDGNSATDAPGTSRSSEDRDDESGEQPAPETVPREEPAPAPAALAPAIPGAKPFQFNASGSVHTLPGATELPDGSLVIAKDSLTDLRRTLASQRELSANFRKTQSEFTRQLTAARSERTNKDVEADAVLGLLADVTKMTAEERWEWAQRFDEERPKLELEIQRQQLDRDRQALIIEREGPKPSEEEQVEQVQAVLTGELNATFQRLAALPDAKAFTRDELLGLYQKWSSRTDRLARQATADDPAQGITKGDWLFDDDDIVRDFRFMLSVKQQAAERGPRTSTVNAIPPAVRGGRLPAATGAKKRTTFDREAFMRGEEDDD